MNESLPPDVGDGRLPGAPEPSPEGPGAEEVDAAQTDWSAATSPPLVTARTWRAPARALGYLAAALVGAILLGGSLVVTGAVGRAAPSPSPTLAPTPTAPPNIAEGPSVGSAAAAVTIEIWADYQCPYCRLETMVFGGSMDRQFVLPGIARIMYRDFAFLGQESVDAAAAARCAGRQDAGAYWRYHDLLFASQQGENAGGFTRKNLVSLAGIAGLDGPAFTACLDDPAVAKAVADETAEGRALGVTSTPTLRVSGPGGTRMLPGFSAGWSTISDAVMAAAAVAPSASPAPGASSSEKGSDQPTPMP